MSYSTKSLITDVNGLPIPQYYDVEEGKFKPLTKVTCVQLLEQLPPGENEIGKVRISSGIPEYGWFSTAIPPVPENQDELALGIKVDINENKMYTMYWNGLAWKELE